MKDSVVRGVLLGCVGFLVMSGGMGCAQRGNPEAEQAALGCAKAWLILVDEQHYGESWDESAGIFRGAVERDRWMSMMEALRKPFGKSLTRDVKSTRYCTSLPGAPDGEYVVIQFKSSFENKKSAVETVTPMKDTNGTWRVSGYYIK